MATSRRRIVSATHGTYYPHVWCFGHINKKRIVLCLLLAGAILCSSCETLVRAFADQTGRNIADAIFGKSANEEVQKKSSSPTDNLEATMESFREIVAELR